VFLLIGVILPFIGQCIIIRENLFLEMKGAVKNPLNVVYYKQGANYASNKNSKHPYPRNDLGNIAGKCPAHEGIERKPKRNGSAN
jgi:hypothetical protein